jgi:hypothetical protein
VTEFVHIKFNEETDKEINEDNIDSIGVEPPRVKENVTRHEQSGGVVVEERQSNVLHQ